MTSWSTRSSEATEAGGNAGPRPLELTALDPGALVGRYIVLHRVGAGGMGVVYAAFDPKLDRRIALKLLRPLSGARAAGQRSLLREAQALAKLSHPNVVAVHDVGELDDIVSVAPDGAPRSSVFIAMEFVEGESLRSWLGRPRSWREIVEVFVHAGRGLAAAHDLGLVHRDFKPDNVTVGEASGAHEARVRVMDFGLARRAHDVGQTPIAGTPAYMAPEQHQGQPIGAEADQFAFCVALYEALYGRRPFAGETPEQVGFGVLRGEMRKPPRSSKVPRWLFRVLARGLAMTPAQRWPAMEALLDALARRDTLWPRVAAAAVGAAVLVAAGLAVHRVERAGSARACADEGRAIDAVWSEADRTRLRTTMAAWTQPVASDTAERVVSWLDRYADDWRSMREMNCRAETLPVGRTAMDVAHARECLDDRRDRLAALVDVVTHGDEVVMLRAVGAAANLPSIAACDDPTRWHLPWPDDAIRAEARRLRSRAAMVHMQLAGGTYLDALAAARELLVETEALGWPPLVAEAQLLVGAAHSSLGDHSEAASAYDVALLLAGANGHDELAAQAASSLAYVHGVSLKDTRTGLVWAGQAQMWLDRLGPGHDDAVAELASHVGTIRLMSGDADAAVVEHRRALAIRERELGPNHPTTVAALAAVGVDEFDRGALSAARDAWDRALDLSEATLGPNHPDVGQLLGELSALEYSEGALDDALDLVEHSWRISARHRGEDSSVTSNLEQHIGLVRFRLGDFGGARAAMEEVYERRDATDPAIVELLVDRGRLELAVGNYEPAVALLERARVLREAALGADHPRLGRALAWLGRAQLDSGDVEGGLVHLERALVLLERRHAGPEVIAMTRFALARGSWSTNGDRPRALAFAAAARSGFLSAGAGWQREADEVDAWLVARVRG